MSMTLTVTNTSATHIRTLILEPMDVSDLHKKIEELRKILLLHKTNTDPLSKKLRKWGLATLKEGRNYLTGSPKEKIDLINKLMSQLREEIPYNPLKINTLTKKYVPLERFAEEREWYWELAMHQECFRLFHGISPLDGQPMAENPQTHPFAQAMIDWAREIPCDTNGLSQEIVVQTHNRQIDGLRMFLYTQMAHSAKVQRTQKEQQATLDTAVVTWKKENDEQKSMTETSIERAKAEAAKHEGQLADFLHEMTRINNERLAHMSNQITDLQKFHQQQEAALENQINAMNAAQAAEAEVLRGQLAKMREAQKREIEVAHHELNAAKKDFANTKHFLEGQIALQTQQQEQTQARLAQIEEEKNRETARLAAEIQAQAARTQELNNSLQQTANRLANAEQQNRLLQEEIYEIDDGWCSIM